MSTNLYWEPARRKKYNTGKDDGLKWALRKRYGEPLRVELSASDVGFLEGLACAGQEDARDLIDAIQEHDEISVFEE